MAACWVVKMVDCSVAKTADPLAAELVVTRAAWLVVEMVVSRAD